MSGQADFDFFAAMERTCRRVIAEELDRRLAALSPPAPVATPTGPGTWNTLAQAAKKMGRSRKTLETYIKAGTLRASRPRPGAPYAVTDEDIDRCMRGLNAQASEPPAVRELTPDDRALMLHTKKDRR